MEGEGLTGFQEDGTHSKEDTNSATSGNKICAKRHPITPIQVENFKENRSKTQTLIPLTSTNPLVASNPLAWDKYLTPTPKKRCTQIKGMHSKEPIPTSLLL